MSGGVITALRARRGRSDRVVVSIDEKATLELAAVLAGEARLRVGVVLSSEDIESLTQRDEPHRARAKALVLLAARDRSAREIETRLGALGFSAETISSTVDWLREREYLDDRRYAEHYASEKLRAGWARRRILSELLRHGVARGVAEEVVASTELDSEVAGEDAERALVETLVRRFGLQYSRDPAGTRRRITGFIARRGYEWEAAERLMRRFEADERMKG